LHCTYIYTQYEENNQKEKRFSLFFLGGREKELNAKRGENSKERALVRICTFDLRKNEGRIDVNVDH
jgi:hypothetical protein